MNPGFWLSPARVCSLHFFLFGESSWSINRYISIPIGFNSNNPLLYYRKFVNLSNASNQI
ncbi:hypothetical protein BLOT_010573 [Blomia tropicalis]|nr:hypothetical protein BLOT_010573 [Blomia tropicalis]